MTTIKQKPSIWVTTVARLLSGDNVCEWAGWFKAHHQGFTKLTGGFNEGEWKMNHTAMLQNIRRNLLLQDPKADIRLEGENQFWIEGQHIDLGGKPDLVVRGQFTSLKGAYLDPSTVIIYDAKTGQPKAGDSVQMLLYMYGLPKVFEEFKGKPLIARLCYKGETLELDSRQVTPEFIVRLTGLMMRLAQFEPEAKRVPSWNECHWCEISKEDCSARIESGSAKNRATTEDF